MTVLILNMPDKETEVPAWIEEQIVGTELRAVVSELSAIHDGSETRPSLDEVLGESATAVLNRGLSELAKPQWKSFLRHPQLLLELQEEVATAGSDFWNQRASSIAANEDQLERTWTRLAADFRPAGHRGQTAQETAPTTQRKRASAIAAAASILATACLLVWIGTRPSDPPPVWGWHAEEALAQDLAAHDYLEHLAVAANDWFNRRPETAEELAVRIGQFRSGCSLVMLARHRPLANEDRRWLVDRCRVWATRLDESLARLEAGGAVRTVRAEVDEIVTRLVSALKTRAGKLAEN